MAAKIIISKGEGCVRKDSTQKVEHDRAHAQVCKRAPSQKERINDRIVQRTVVQGTSNCPSRIAKEKGDPYQGHGVERDELQQAWENSIRVVQEERKRDLRFTSVANRMDSIRKRVQERNRLSDSAVEPPTLRSFIHNEREWLRGRQAELITQAEDTHPGRAIGKVLPDEANGHILRTCDTDAGFRWIWCYKCGAHTHTRIRSLTEQCKGPRNTAQKRRLESSCDPYTNRPNGAQPRDMAWTDVDAVRILEECNKLSQSAANGFGGGECSITHYGQCIGGPSIGPTTVDEDIVVPGDGGMVPDDDDVLAAMQCIA